MEQKLINYINNLSAIGIDLDASYVEQLYNNLSEDIRSNANIILLPLAVADSVVYAMNNYDGSLVPFDFSRNTSGTFFDKDLNLQIATSHIPRIDYGNYSQDVKILIEKESTNYIQNSVDFSSLSSTNVLVEATEYYCKGFNRYFKLEKLNSNASAQIIFTFNNPNANATFSLTGYLKKGNTDKLNVGLYDTKWDATNTTIEILEGEANIGFENSGAPYIILISDEIRFRIARSGMSNGTITMRFYPDLGVSTTIGRYILLSTVQVESGNQITSYIPTTTSQVTRSADQLSFILANKSRIYIKTPKQESIIDKEAGLWNIHEDLSNEGIEALAIFEERNSISSVLASKSVIDSNEANNVSEVLMTTSNAITVDSTEGISSVKLDKEETGVNHGMFL